MKRFIPLSLSSQGANGPTLVFSPSIAQIAHSADGLSTIKTTLPPSKTLEPRFEASVVPATAEHFVDIPVRPRINACASRTGLSTEMPEILSRELGPWDLQCTAALIGQAMRLAFSPSVESAEKRSELRKKCSTRADPRFEHFSFGISLELWIRMGLVDQCRRTRAR